MIRWYQGGESITPRAGTESGELMMHHLWLFLAVAGSKAYLHRLFRCECEILDWANAMMSGFELRLPWWRRV